MALHRVAPCAILKRSPPRFADKIDRLGETSREPGPQRYPKLRSNFTAIDGLAPVVTGAILDVGTTSVRTRRQNKRQAGKNSTEHAIFEETRG